VHITVNPTPPFVETLPATHITPTTATLHKIVNIGSETIDAQGFYYKQTSTAEWMLTSNDNLSGLSANTEYAFYAYAITATYTMHGDTLTFITHAVLPEIVTDSVVVDSDCKSALFYGTIVEAGIPQAIEYGFVYGTEANVLLHNATKVEATIHGATITASVTDLSDKVQYHYNVYALTASDTTYGTEQTFTCNTVHVVDVRLDNVSINLYPNPATDIATLAFEGLTSDAQILISDLSAKVIFTTNIKANQKILEINVSPFAAGTYYIQIHNNEINKTHKLIINK
jgi:hypothetical protein